MSYRISLHKINDLQSYVKLDKELVIENIKNSGLLGRSGAAFPVYKKWELLKQPKSDEKYLIINAHEGEIGCNKDYWLLMNNIDAVIDGALITAYCNDIKKIILSMKESDFELVQYVQDKIPENIALHLGSNKYVAGEETALIETIENRLPFPQEKPPYPMQKGLYGKPTLVHNVETLANISYIARNGIEEFVATGTEENKGTKIISISGDVPNPCVVEVEFGCNLLKTIEMYTGFSANEIIAIVPGLSRTIYDCKSLTLDYKSFKDAGSDFGTGNIAVFTSKESLKFHLRNSVFFLSTESCGQCSICRILSKISKKILDTDLVDDKNELIGLMNNVRNCSRCSLMVSLIDSLFNYMELI